jgi:DNA-directed RNA polymerase subunit RPC12/RpoP
MSIIKKGEIAKINICHFTWVCKACGHKILEEPKELSMHYNENIDKDKNDKNDEDKKGDIKCPKCENGIMSFE